MTARQLRTFRVLVQRWREVGIYGTGGAAMAWADARKHVDDAFGFKPYCQPDERWFAFNHRVISATHRLTGAKAVNQ